ncbi:MAG: hypothetical protein MJE68_16195 [Proteobacteria bacterium]|nr:hypothetical protein [Pseudomonadota bacterium]
MNSVNTVDYLVDCTMGNSKKRKGTDLDVEEVVKRSRESRRRGKGEFVTPELLDTKSKP